MGPRSDPGFLVLHSLRLKGLATADVVGVATDLPHPKVQSHLEAHREQGFAFHREGRVAGWSLTPLGRQEHADRCAAEVAAVGDRRDQVTQCFGRFQEVNQPFLEVCTAWQVFGGGGSGALTLNDHTDAVYDAGVIGRLGEIRSALDAIVADLSGVLSRFGNYGGRFARALDRVTSGETEWFTGALIDSCHTVWFELHEDLLATLAIERAAEHAK